MSAEKATSEELLGEHLQLVGTIAAFWAQFEFYLELLIWEIAGVAQGPGACLTSAVGSTHGKLRILKALLHLMGASDKLIKSTNKLSEKTQKILALRNRAVHDEWTVGMKTGTVYQHRATVVGEKLLFGQVKIKPEELQDTIKQMRKHNMRLYILGDAIRDELSALPEKWRERLPQIQLTRLRTLDPDID